MSNPSNNGWPAVATTANGSGASVSSEEVPPARGFFPTPSSAATPLLPQWAPNPVNPVVATLFNALPPMLPQWTPNPVNPSPSGSTSSSHGRGRHPLRSSNHSRSKSYLPRRPPQEPRLPVTLGPGGQILPNSEAELAAHRKVKAEFIKDSARYNEAKSRSTSGGSLKRSHRDLNSGNGNYNQINSDNHANRGCAHSPSPNGVSMTMQNSVPQTTQNLVPQTTLTAQQALGDEFLHDFNSVNHLAQLDRIKDLDREQRNRGTTIARRVQIHRFLRTIEVVDQVVEGPAAKRLHLSKNGKPAYEVLILHSTKDKQLALTSEDFNAIMAEAMAFIRTLNGEVNPEWNWQSWSKGRGRIEVSSEVQAQLVAALFNGLEVAGVTPFHLWRADEIVVLTQVKLKLDGGHLYKVPVDEIIQGLLGSNAIKGTYSEPVKNTDYVKHHVVFFMANPTLRSSLERCQSGSSTFFLNLWGQDRELVMARDLLVVAAEEAAVMRTRVETALAKAMATSERLALIPVASAAAMTGGVEEPAPDQQQQQQHQQGLVAPPMSNFMRQYQQVQREHRELLQQQQQQEQPQQQQEQQQQQPEAAGLEDYHDWAAKNLPDQQHQQQQQQQQGKATFSIINYLIDKQTTYPPSVVKERIASIKEHAASPPHGVDPQTLVGGLPLHDSSFSSTSSTVSIILRKQKPKSNTSTGSVEVDGLELKLGDADMDTNKEEDTDLYLLAKENSDMEEGEGT
jgi:hypothetical protein